jgi:hypothetical protein
MPSRHSVGAASRSARTLIRALESLEGADECAWRSGPPRRGATLNRHHRIRCNEAGSLLCSHLDRGERSGRCGYPPRRYGPSYLQHSPILRHEHDVYRELHEECVDRIARRDDERRARRQAGVLQQTRSAAGRVKRREQRRGNHGTRRSVYQLKTIGRMFEERCEEVRHGASRAW